MCVCIYVLTHAHTHTHTQVQENGCRALRNLMHRNDANKTRVARAGGAQRIVTAMATHR